VDQRKHPLNENFLFLGKNGYFSNWCAADLRKEAQWKNFALSRIKLAFTDRATPQAELSCVCALVRRNFCEGTSFTESGINPPFALTFRVSVASENGLALSHP